MVQQDMVRALQKLSPKSDHERARVTEMMRTRDHVALFGVKYHAELVHIERKWMRLQQRIWPKLDGKLGTLRKLLEQNWPQYSVDEARRAARHCRETIRAYVELGDAATLDQLQDAKKQKAHRKVIDSADGILKLKANLVMTEDQKKAENLVTWREMAKQRETRIDLNAKELESEMARRQVLARKRRKREEDRAAAQAEANFLAKAPAEAEAPAKADAAEASRELDAPEKEAQKGHLSSSEVVEAADALRARYGL